MVYFHLEKKPQQTDRGKPVQIPMAPLFASTDLRPSPLFIITPLRPTFEQFDVPVKLLNCHLINTTVGVRNQFHIHATRHLTYRCLIDTLCCMRTTIRLDDQFLKSAKRLAHSIVKSLTAVIEESLRQTLIRRSTTKRTRRPVKLTTVSGLGVCSGVDLDDSAALLNLKN